MNFKKKTAACLKTSGMMTEQAATVIGKGASIGGKLLQQGIQTVGKTIQEDKENLKYIQESRDFYQETMDQITQQRQQCERDFDRETRAYNVIVGQVNEQMQAYDIVLQYLSNMESRKLPVYINPVSNLAAGPPEMNLTVPAVSFAAGSAAGLATGAGTIGLVTALGTASTGTAISSLSGAAYTHALLAALGGGSLATGGFGMVGGMFVLSTAVLAPAGVVAGYFADKKIKEQYQKAVEFRAKTQKLRQESQRFFQSYTRGLSLYRQLNQDFSAFSLFFGDLLNMSAAACIMAVKQSYKSILAGAAAVIRELACIMPLDAHGQLNAAVEADLMRVGQNAAACRQAFYEYNYQLTSPQQEALAAARQGDIRQLETKLKAAWETIQQQKDTIARQKDYIGSLNVKLANLRDHIQPLQGDDERATALYEGAQAVQQDLVVRDQKYTEYCRKIAAQYACLDNKAICFLATGEVVYELYSQIGEMDIDYSPVVLDYAKSIEYLLTVLLRQYRLLDRNDTRTLGKAINQYVKNKKLRYQWPEGFLDVLEEITRYRNACAHPHGVCQQTAKTVRMLILGPSAAPFSNGILLCFDTLLGQRMDT